jgi:UDP-3-O-[3-hydroxymyristoyl] glucosamine N-acyltransferase
MSVYSFLSIVLTLTCRPNILFTDMTASISLGQIATQIGATLEGAADQMLPITGIATLKQANAQQVTFYTNDLYREDLKNTAAAAVILAKKDQHYCQVPTLVMDNPYLGYARAAKFFSTINQSSSHRQPEIHPSAWVSPEAILGADISIGPQVVIEAGAVLGNEVDLGPGCVVGEGVVIGDNCQLHAHVVLCKGTRLGQRVIIHPGAVIGSDGFGNANDAGIWVKVPQLGRVVIGDDVEIGANTTIDKGALDDTIIGNGVKLDNQIQIGHNVQIGEHTAIAGCVGIAGSTHIGSYCMIGGGVGIAGHLELADHVHVTGGSLVFHSIREAGLYSSGMPLTTNSHWHRIYRRLKKLDELAQRLQTLEHSLNDNNHN